MGETRSQKLARLSGGDFDLVIVGGGITGVAIASRATLSGYNVALLERRDFASGTTSASSKMLHGGLRYLEQGHLSLVRESLKERGRLVRRLGTSRAKIVPFLLPLRNDLGKNLRIRFGTWVYQRLSGGQALGPRAVLTEDEVHDMVPTLDRKNLRGGILYHEGVIDDSLLVMDVLAEAVSRGAVALNHVEVTGLLVDNQRTRGVRFADKLTGETGEVRSRGVVNASGVWARSWPGEGRTPEMRPSKGVHIVFRKESFPISCAVVMEAPNGRWVFALPYGSLVVVGTTDTEYSGDPDSVRPEVGDIDYLMSTIRREFPSLPLGPKDIVDSFAGLRPLLATNEGSTGDLSREDLVHIDESGLLTTVGGKLTTHAAMAERTLLVWEKANRLGHKPVERARNIRPYDGEPWPGSDWLAGHSLWDWKDHYRALIPTVYNAIETLSPATLEDIIDRRIHPLFRLDPVFPELVTSIARIAGKRMGWSPADTDRQARDYLQHLNWISEGVRACQAREDEIM